jgi:hypothetical protein
MESELLSLCWKQTWKTPLLLIDDLCLECPAEQPPSSSSTCAEASASVSIPASAIQAQSDCLPIDHQSINLISRVFFPTGVLHWSGKKRQKISGCQTYSSIFETMAYFGISGNQHWLLGVEVSTGLTPTIAHFMCPAAAVESQQE